MEIPSWLYERGKFLILCFCCSPVHLLGMELRKEKGREGKMIIYLELNLYEIYQTRSVDSNPIFKK